MPLDVWRLIYATLELPLPMERMASVRGKLGMGVDDRVQSIRRARRRKRRRCCRITIRASCWCGGSCGLREQWEDHLRRIAALAANNETLAPFHAVIYGDQVALATSLQALRVQGHSFESLPDGFNARLVHFRAGAMRWEQVAAVSRDRVPEGDARTG